MSSLFAVACMILFLTSSKGNISEQYSSVYSVLSVWRTFLFFANLSTTAYTHTQRRSITSHCEYRAAFGDLIHNQLGLSHTSESIPACGITFVFTSESMQMMIYNDDDDIVIMMIMMIMRKITMAMTTSLFSQFKSNQESFLNHFSVAIVQSIQAGGGCMLHVLSVRRIQCACPWPLAMSLPFIMVVP